MKKRMYLRMVSLLLCVVMMASIVTGCGGDSEKKTTTGQVDDEFNLNGEEADNSEKTLECYIYSAGYGVEWFNKIAKKFEEKTGYDVKVNIQSSGSSIGAMIQAGGKNTTADLFIIGGYMKGLVAKGESAVDGYDVCLESLDDVYESKVEGEDITVEEKLKESVRANYLQEVEINGELETHYYGMPWLGSYQGLMYNKDLFDKAGLSGEPRTTEELKEYASALSSKGITPFVYSSQDDYWEYLSTIWWSQYEELEGIERFYTGLAGTDRYPSSTNAINIFKQEGLYEMFKVFEELLHPDTGWSYEFCESLEYTKAQLLFISGDEKYGAMQPNGTWLEYEMNSTSSGVEIGNILPMKTPIISALSDKMSYWAEGVSYTEARNNGALTDAKKKDYDAKLRQIVDYVDGVTSEKPSFATDEDIKVVTEARSLIAGGGGGTMAIPAYATAKKAAKEFIKYMATDEAIEIYLEETKGSCPPFNYDVTKWSGYENLSNFAKHKFEIMENSTPILTEDVYPSYYISNLRYDYGLTDYNFAITFGSQSASSRKTTDQVINDVIKYYEPRIVQMLKDCGLL